MMKKTIALLLTLMLILGTATVSLASQPGETVEVKSNISGAGQSFGVYVDYPSELQFVSASTPA